MKCLETEALISYAYHLIDEPAAAQVRAHLGECPRCREIVEQHGRLGALLDEWKAAEPTPGFDARVRQAVEAQQARRKAWGFWGWDWARGLALASLGVLLVAGAVWFTRNHRSASNSSGGRSVSYLSGVAMQRPQQASSPQAPAQAGVKTAQGMPELKSAGVSFNEDKDTQALEDYDLAANFDLLSELPKGEPRVAN
jgi:anti-sigma factor RsiW